MEEKNKLKNRYMFTDFFAPYLEQVKSNINTSFISKGIEVNLQTCTNLFNDLYENLFKLAIRALIRELHDLKNNDCLKGDNGEERFSFFEKMLTQRRYRKKFFDSYPMLDQLMNDYVVSVSDYIIEIIADFKNDRKDLENCFGLEQNRITDISIGKGDTHNGGKSVAIIYLDDKKIIYKPHSLNADFVFEKIIHWLNNNATLPFPLKYVKTLNKQDHGWQEWIESVPCHNKEEVERYYYRMGCFLAIFHLLGTTDLHFENVIAANDCPMFIDLETLLSNNRNDKLSTVLDTGLLPQPTSNFLIDVDISGICGKSNKSDRMKMMVIKNRQTDEMMVDEIPAVIENRKNIVLLGGEAVDIEDYTSYLIDGYKVTIDFILKQKNEFIGLLDNYIGSSDLFRTVLRHTQVYSKYLSASLHPDYLTSKDKRRELFIRLESNCKDQHELPRVKDEVETLVGGDVPYFIFDYYGKNLYSNNGPVIKNYYDHSAREVLIERIDNFQMNQKANINLIQKSLFTTYTSKKVDKCGEAVVIKDEDRLLKYAQYLLDDTFLLHNREAGIQFINCLYNNKVSLETINLNMYEGGGIILYLAAMSKVYHDKRYIETADKLLETAVQVLKYKSSKDDFDFKLSAFSGYGSMLYLSYLLYFLTNEQKYEEFANQAMQHIFDSDYLNRNKEIHDYDYLGGIAGEIVCMAHILLKRENEEIRSTCMKMGNIMEDYVNNTPVKAIGLAHGLSGYAYAYIMLYRITENVLYLNKAKELLVEEDRLYMRGRKGKTSWCKGETGMCLARLCYLELDRCPQMLERFSYYYEVLTTKGLCIDNSCLCHGLYGNIEVINRINQFDFIEEEKKFKEYENSLLGIKGNIKLGFNSKFSSDIFMTGLSGVHYSILRVKETNLPSVLFLEV